MRVACIQENGIAAVVIKTWHPIPYLHGAIKALEGRPYRTRVTAQAVGVIRQQAARLLAATMSYISMRTFCRKLLLAWQVPAGEAAA